MFLLQVHSFSGLMYCLFLWCWDIISCKHTKFTNVFSIFQLLGDIDDLIEWFGETEQAIQDTGPISCDPEELRIQLRDHKTLNDDINAQKARARDMISAAKRIRRESGSLDEDPVIKDKMDDLKHHSDNLTKMSADRLSILEQALPLAKDFTETHEDLMEWLDDTERDVVKQEPPALNTEQIKQQQDMVKVRTLNTCNKISLY